MEETDRPAAGTGEAEGTDAPEARGGVGPAGGPAPAGGPGAGAGPRDLAALRDAATIILVREGAEGPHVLMGRRGAGAAFMPSKYVFPGGAVDPGDAGVPFGAPLGAADAARLAEGCAPGLGHALAAAAIRELWEEAGLVLGRPGAWPDAPRGWRGFAATGHLPDASALRLVFRAITPPGRPRRFDARFFMAGAERLAGDPDNFTHAEDELSDLAWVPLGAARGMDLPFITEVVLAEVAAILRGEAQGDVPFFRNDDEESLFLRLRGRAPGAAD